MGLFYKYKLGDKVCVISVRDYNNRTDCNKLEIDIILDSEYYRNEKLNKLGI